MDEVQELNQDLKRPEAMEDFELEERQIAKELREIMEQMQKEGGEQKKQEGERQDGQKDSDQNQARRWPTGGEQDQQDQPRDSKVQQKQSLPRAQPTKTERMQLKK